MFRIRSNAHRCAARALKIAMGGAASLPLPSSRITVDLPATTLLRRARHTTVARALFPTAPFPQTAMRLYASKVKAARIKRTTMCGLSQETLFKFLKECLDAKGNPKGLFKTYFYNASDPAANPHTAALVKKFKTPKGDTLHRCNECGCTISQHVSGVSQLDPNIQFDTFTSLATVDTGATPKVLVARDDEVDSVIKYAEFVRAAQPHKTPPGPEFWTIVGNQGRSTLLGTSGMPGIGKTAVLFECAYKLNREPSKYHAIYVTFNGGWPGLAAAFGDYAIATRDPNLLNAFGVAVLGACVTSDEYLSKLQWRTCTFETAMKIYRRHAGLSDDVALLFLVDEIGNLVDPLPASLASELMRRQDETISSGTTGRVGFVFTAIYNFLDGKKIVTKASNRQVRFLPLPPLPINTWKSIEEVKAFAKSSPAARHLVLLCAGHPRSLYESLPAVAVRKTDLNDPVKFTEARQMIFDALKLKASPDWKFLEAALGQWIRSVVENRAKALRERTKQRLINEGCVFTDLNNGSFSMLVPVVWSRVADIAPTSCPILKQLNGYYTADRMLSPGVERHFETVTLHYELLQRVAWAGNKNSRPVKLGTLFCTPHVEAHLKDRVVVVPYCNDERFERVDSFGDDVSAVHKHLREGKIVVSNKSTELGIEYLSPFFDAADPTKLLVAAVQCKFQPGVGWGEVNEKWKLATKALKTRDIEFFAVVYSVSDVTTPNAASFANGFVFTATDLFAQTAHLGILRTHTEKLSSSLHPEYQRLIR